MPDFSDRSTLSKRHHRMEEVKEEMKDEEEK
jgi:hypothetical protein